MGTDYDAVYDGDDANEVVAIYMTKRQWWHLDDWRAEHADRYPKRAAERAAAWRAIEAAASAGEPPRRSDFEGGDGSRLRRSRTAWLRVGAWLCRSRVHS
jgi:hypothetical protein